MLPPSPKDPLTAAVRQGPFEGCISIPHAEMKLSWELACWPLSNGVIFLLPYQMEMLLRWCFTSDVRRVQRTGCCEQAGGLVLLEGADIDPHLQAGGQETMWIGHQELGSFALSLCIEMRRRRRSE